MNKNLCNVSLLVIWFLLSGFGVDIKIKIPEKKIAKSINKIWKTENFKLMPNNTLKCNSNGCWYLVVNEEKNIGQVYVGRVNSCRSGGCVLESGEDDSFEFFDYLLFTNIEGKVLWVKVFNYQATQGHEVMSRGWLNQFKGLFPGKKLIFGQDIESISGATISATAITTDIQDVLSCAF